MSHNGSPKEGKIYAAMANVMAEVGHIGKDQTNPQQRYNFRGIDDVYNHLQPILAKHKIFILPTANDTKQTERTSRGGSTLICTTIDVTYRFVTTDGSSVEICAIGEGMDSGDKSTNKAMSAAQKYALLQAFCIPTQERKDSEYDSPELLESAGPAAQAPAQAPTHQPTDQPTNGHAAVTGDTIPPDNPKMDAHLRAWHVINETQEVSQLEEAKLRIQMLKPELKPHEMEQIRTLYQKRYHELHKTKPDFGFQQQ